MRSKFTVLCSTFYVLLAGCGGQLPSFVGVSPNSSSSGGSPSLTITFPELNDDFSEPNFSSNPETETSPNSYLENFVKQIHSPNYSGYLVVQLDSPQSLNVLKSVPEFSPLFSAMAQNQARQLEVVSGKTLPDLSVFYKITISDPNHSEEILRQLWKVSGVRFIYPRIRGSLLGIETVPDFSSTQGYLNRFEKSGGLSIEAAWEKGVQGEGVAIFDSETDWNPDHEDLPRQPTIRRYNVAFTNAARKAHGTAVLGILGAVENPQHGIRGITSQTTLVTTDATDPTGTSAGNIFLYEEGW